MNVSEYQSLVKKYKPKEHRTKNATIAFITGGLLGFLCEVISYFICKYFHVSQNVSYMIICLFMILIATFLTCVNVFDKLVEKCKCGLIIPTTGFAHSVSSCALEYKKEGLITGIGSNFFKLAGSVILYGIISAFFLCLIKVVIISV